jgi:serine/threonine-protein kinase RsbW
VRLNEHIEIRIFSQGESFDLEQQLQATLELENNYNSRGRGLKIMSTIADKFSYEPTKDNRYCLFMSKNYGSSVSSN